MTSKYRDPLELVELGRQLRAPTSEIHKLLERNQEQASAHGPSAFARAHARAILGVPEPAPAKPAVPPAPKQDDAPERERKAREKKRNALRDERDETLLAAVTAQGVDIKFFGATGRANPLSSVQKHKARLAALDRELAALDEAADD